MTSLQHQHHHPVTSGQLSRLSHHQPAENHDAAAIPCTIDTLRLPPGVPVHLPGTNTDLQWDGPTTATIHRHHGIWDLSPLTRPGRMLLKQRLTHRPHLGWWPITPLPTRATYRTRQPAPLAASAIRSSRRQAAAAASGPERTSDKPS